MPSGWQFDLCLLYSSDDTVNALTEQQSRMRRRSMENLELVKITPDKVSPHLLLQGQSLSLIIPRSIFIAYYLKVSLCLIISRSVSYLNVSLCLLSSQGQSLSLFITRSIFICHSINLHLSSFLLSPSVTTVSRPCVTVMVIFRDSICVLLQQKDTKSESVKLANSKMKLQKAASIATDLPRCMQTGKAGSQVRPLWPHMSSSQKVVPQVCHM